MKPRFTKAVKNTQVQWKQSCFQANTMTSISFARENPIVKPFQQHFHPQATFYSYCLCCASGRQMSFLNTTGGMQSQSSLKRMKFSIQVSQNQQFYFFPVISTDCRDCTGSQQKQQVCLSSKTSIYNSSQNQVLVKNTLIQFQCSTPDRQK